MGPHPSVAAVRRAARGALTGRSGLVLVACSGGADSLALAAATAFVAPRLGVAAGLVTVDHGLQPGSADRARLVAEIGYDLGFDPVEVVPVYVGTAGGPEAAARAARYAALDGVAAALDASVLLGHTMDDQAETVLLGLGRGSGPRSIAGMRAEDGRYLRPLLGLGRATTVDACAALGLEPWDDPHNADPSFQRVRLRTEVVPLLEDVLQGGVVEALARTADLVRADLDALDDLVPAGSWSAGDRDGPSESTMEVERLAAMPLALRARALRAWAAAAGAGPLTSVHLASLDALASDWRGQGPVDLPGGLRARRASGRLEAIPPEAQPPDQQES